LWRYKRHLGLYRIQSEYSVERYLSSHPADDSDDDQSAADPPGLDDFSSDTSDISDVSDASDELSPGPGGSQPCPVSGNEPSEGELPTAIVSDHDAAKTLLLFSRATAVPHASPSITKSRSTFDSPAPMNGGGGRRTPDGKRKVSSASDEEHLTKRPKTSEGEPTREVKGDRTELQAGSEEEGVSVAVPAYGQARPSPTSSSSAPSQKPLQDPVKPAFAESYHDERAAEIFCYPLTFDDLVYDLPVMYRRKPQSAYMSGALEYPDDWVSVFRDDYEVEGWVDEVDYRRPHAPPKLQEGGVGNNRHSGRVPSDSGNKDAASADERLENMTEEERQLALDEQMARRLENEWRWEASPPHQGQEGRMLDNETATVDHAETTGASTEFTLRMAWEVFMGDKKRAPPERVLLSCMTPFELGLISVAFGQARNPDHRVLKSFSSAAVAVAKLKDHCDQGDLAHLPGLAQFKAGLLPLLQFLRRNDPERSGQGKSSDEPHPDAPPKHRMMKKETASAATLQERLDALDLAGEKLLQALTPEQHAEGLRVGQKVFQRGVNLGCYDDLLPEGIVVSISDAFKQATRPDLSLLHDYAAAMEALRFLIRRSLDDDLRESIPDLSYIAQGFCPLLKFLYQHMPTSQRGFKYDASIDFTDNQTMYDTMALVARYEISLAMGSGWTKNATIGPALPSILRCLESLTNPDAHESTVSTESMETALRALIKGITSGELLWDRESPRENMSPRALAVALNVLAKACWLDAEESPPGSEGSTPRGLDVDVIIGEAPSPLDSVELQADASGAVNPVLAAAINDIKAARGSSSPRVAAVLTTVLCDLEDVQQLGASAAVARTRRTKLREAYDVVKGIEEGRTVDTSDLEVIDTVLRIVEMVLAMELSHFASASKSGRSQTDGDITMTDAQEEAPNTKDQREQGPSGSPVLDAVERNAPSYRSSRVQSGSPSTKAHHLVVVLEQLQKVITQGSPATCVENDVHITLHCLLKAADNEPLDSSDVDISVRCLQDLNHDQVNINTDSLDVSIRVLKDALQATQNPFSVTSTSQLGTGPDSELDPELLSEAAGKLRQLEELGFDNPLSRWLDIISLDVVNISVEVAQSNETSSLCTIFTDEDLAKALKMVLKYKDGVEDILGPLNTSVVVAVLERAKGILKAHEKKKAESERAPVQLGLPEETLSMLRECEFGHGRFGGHDVAIGSDMIRAALAAIQPLSVTADGAEVDVHAIGRALDGFLMFRLVLAERGIQCRHTDVVIQALLEALYPRIKTAAYRVISAPIGRIRQVAAEALYLMLHDGNFRWRSSRIDFAIALYKFVHADEEGVLDALDGEDWVVAVTATALRWVVYLHQWESCRDKGGPFEEDVPHCPAAASPYLGQLFLPPPQPWHSSSQHATASPLERGLALLWARKVLNNCYLGRYAPWRWRPDESWPIPLDVGEEKEDDCSEELEGFLTELEAAREGKVKEEIKEEPGLMEARPPPIGGRTSPGSQSLADLDEKEVVFGAGSWSEGLVQEADSRVSNPGQPATLDFEEARQPLDEDAAIASIARDGVSAGADISWPCEEKEENPQPREDLPIDDKHAACLLGSLREGHRPEQTAEYGLYDRSGPELVPRELVGTTSQSSLAGSEQESTATPSPPPTPKLSHKSLAVPLPTSPCPPPESDSASLDEYFHSFEQLRLLSPALSPRREASDKEDDDTFVSAPSSSSLESVEESGVTTGKDTGPARRSRKGKRPRYAATKMTHGPSPLRQVVCADDESDM
jgi:hypothetical protein